jgi:hypothetical protein
MLTFKTNINFSFIQIYLLIVTPFVSEDVDGSYHFWILSSFLYILSNIETSLFEGIQ